MSGTSSWYDAGAVSSQAIVAGDGYMEFTPGETATGRMCGLGTTDSSAYYGDIDYAFYTAGGGTLQIYESGNLRGSFGTYAAGDRLKVAVEGGVVKYYRNSTLVYTSTVAPPYPLQVDTSLNTVNAGVYNVVISGPRLAASSINYVLQDVQGSTRAVMSGASVVARHDFLPFGEELAAGVGLRTSGQGFGVADKIRQRYGLTERDDSTGLDHTWWRKYENLSGRWTSADPYLGSMSIAEPQSFNRYSYVQNDPVNFVDPSGLEPWIFTHTLFDDAWFIPASQQGWNQIFGLNPISFTFTYTEHIGDRYWLQRTTITLWNFPQNPYDVNNIIREAIERAKERERTKNLNNKAWNEYQQCVSGDPATIEYNRALNVATLKASIPVPGPISLARVKYRMDRGAAFVSMANVQTLIFGGMLHVLLSNPSVETRPLRDKVRPIEDRCMEQTKKKYNFTPLNPWLFRNY